jgi:hypothetical protein
MTSFLVSHKEVNRVSPSRNPVDELPLAGLKEDGRLLSRFWCTRTKPNHLGLALECSLARRGWLSVFSTLAIGFLWLAPPLRAQFAYVANPENSTVSAYSTRCRRVSDAGPRVALRNGAGPSQWPWIQRASSPTWLTYRTTPSRPTASAQTGL